MIYEFSTQVHWLCVCAACRLMVNPLLDLQYLIGFDNHIFHLFSKPLQIFHGFFDTLTVAGSCLHTFDCTVCHRDQFFYSVIEIQNYIINVLNRVSDFSITFLGITDR